MEIETDIFTGESLLPKPPATAPAEPVKPPAFSPHGTDLFGEIIKPANQPPLKERFLFPPFSVLDARQGEWQDRKRAWIAMGIKSELGRGGAVNGSEGSNNGEPELLSQQRKTGGVGQIVPRAEVPDQHVITQKDNAETVREGQ